MKWTAFSLLALSLTCIPVWAQRGQAASDGMAGQGRASNSAGVNGRSFAPGVRGPFRQGFCGEGRCFDRFGSRYGGYYWPGYYPGYFGDFDYSWNIGDYWTFPDEREAPPQTQAGNQPSVIVLQAAEPAAPPASAQPPKLIEVPLDNPAQGKNESASKPSPPAVFILSDGEHLEARRYMVTVDGVRLQQGLKERIIPLSALNLDATIAANHEHGIDLQIPENRNQIMLGF